jgi:hypothetical protein
MCIESAATTRYLPVAAAAFLGALFAFLFMRVAELLSRRRDRWTKHHTALVRIERLSNEQLDILSQSMYQLDGMVTGIDEALRQGGVPFLGNRPVMVPLDRDLELNLANLDLLNDVLEHRRNIAAINVDQEMMSSIVSDLQRAFSDQLVDQQVYAANLTLIRNQHLPDLRKHLEAAAAETKLVVAKCRARLERDRPLGHRVLLWSRRTRYEGDFALAVEEQRASLEEEIKAVHEASDARIRGITGEPRETK